jgi:hypothetical protein
MLVLVLLFMLAVCSSDAYVDSDIIHVQGLKNLRDLYDRGAPYYNEYKLAYDHYVNRTTNPNIPYQLVFLSTPDPYASNFSNSFINLTTEWEPKLMDLRKEEYASVLEPSIISNNIQFIASYSTKSYSVIESQINVFRTSFIVIVLGLASIYFTKDAQELVLDPLERMIEKIKAIAKNPLVAASEEVNEAGVMSFLSQTEQN